jgi:hypothetical protein
METKSGSEANDKEVTGVSSEVALLRCQVQPHDLLAVRHGEWTHFFNPSKLEMVLLTGHCLPPMLSRMGCSM